MCFGYALRLGRHVFLWLVVGFGSWLPDVQGCQQAVLFPGREWPYAFYQLFQVGLESPAGRMLVASPHIVLFHTFQLSHLPRPFAFTSRLCATHRTALHIPCQLLAWMVLVLCYTVPLLISRPFGATKYPFDITPLPPQCTVCCPSVTCILPEPFLPPATCSFAIKRSLCSWPLLAVDCFVSPALGSRPGPS